MINEDCVVRGVWKVTYWCDSDEDTIQSYVSVTNLLGYRLGFPKELERLACDYLENGQTRAAKHVVEGWLNGLITTRKKKRNGN